MKDVYGRGNTKYLRWTDGRQGSGYKIMYLWNWLFDLVIIRYPTDSFIHWHVDPVPAPFKHHRVNIVVKEAEAGGDFEYRPGMSFIRTRKRFMRFRPDIQQHMVHKITKGERWVFSIGWLSK